MDEGKLRLSAQAGDRAKALLENELLKEAFATLYDGCIDGWRKSADVETRESMYWQLKGLQAAEHHLRKLLQNGELAKRDLEELAMARKREVEARERRRQFNVA